MTTTAEGMARILKSGAKLDEACDECGSAAWVEVEFMVANDTGVRVKHMLFFCAHHYEARPSLALAASRIVDHREALYRMEGRTS